MSLPPRNHPIQLPRPNISCIALLQTRNPHERHRRRELLPQNLHQVLHALLPVVDGVEEGAAEPDGCRAQAEAFEDVGAAPDAAVDEDLEVVEDGGAVELHFEEGEEWGWGAMLTVSIKQGMAGGW